MNKKWHSEHPMPKKPDLSQRIEWHNAHAKACACRPIPKSVRDAIAKHKILPVATASAALRALF
jgi:hypothetical protein